ncbi:MAG: hypothetical protein SLRJCFUN_001888, partial [Candidatus Fervidibacter sp.]
TVILALLSLGLGKNRAFPISLPSMERLGD